MTMLQRIRFTPAELPKVQQFDCGNEIWQLEISNWIKAPFGGDGAADAVTAADTSATDVWLYADDDGNLVGFGSLAESWQRWPKAKDPEIRVSVIPYMAIDRRFWGQPPGPWQDRYAAQILRNLIDEASKHRDLRPLLKLLVYEKNDAAIKLYERVGFVEYHKPRRDPSNGLLYKRMALVL